jgi:catechol 2,3-dioxygenase-like lactoylglutathione lyase family enzyme
MKVLFVAGFGPIVRDPKVSAGLYRGVFGLEFKEEEGEYLHTEDVDGVRSFGLWPLAHAAESCFGTAEWPADTPVPQAWIEFDVEDLEAATAELAGAGYRMLVADREEPWGQKVSRFLSPEGLLVGVTVTPWMRG